MLPLLMKSCVRRQKSHLEPTRLPLAVVDCTPSVVKPQVSRLLLTKLFLYFIDCMFQQIITDNLGTIEI